MFSPPSPPASCTRLSSPAEDFRGTRGCPCLPDPWSREAGVLPPVALLPSLCPTELCCFHHLLPPSVSGSPLWEWGWVHEECGGVSLEVDPFPVLPLPPRLRYPLLGAAVTFP